MAQFPRTKPEMDALAQAIVSGVATNPTDYPAPMFATTALTARMTATAQAIADRQQKEADFRLAVDHENLAYDLQNAEARRLLDLAEAQHKTDPNRLLLIGWSGTADPDARVPGAPRNLEAHYEGPGRVFLDWKAPRKADGGSVTYYRVERRTPSTDDFGGWQSIVIPSEAHLTGQPHGAELEYRVIAINPTGESLPSNSIRIAL